MRAKPLLALLFTACLGCTSNNIEKNETTSESEHSVITSDGVLVSDPEGFQSPYMNALRDENYAAAETIAKEMLQKDRDDPRNWHALAQAQLLAGRLITAKDSCNQALAISPNDASILYTRGFIAQESAFNYYELDDYANSEALYQSAVGYYEKAIANDAELADPYYGLAAANEGLGNFELALRAAKQYLKLYPDSPKKNEALDMIRFAKENLPNNKE